MTPTIMGISAITIAFLWHNHGLQSIDGKGSENFGPTNKEGKSYGRFLDSAFNPYETSPASDNEHIDFLIFWLCHYMFSTSALQITQEFYHVTIPLSRGIHLALTPAILCRIYCTCLDSRLFKQ